MKSTGITRHIDELGRIVIPKEIRTNLSIEVNDLLEFYIENNKLVLEKTARLKKINDVMDKYLNVFFQEVKKSIIICDKEKIIGVTKDISRNLLNKNLSEENKTLLFSSKSQGKISIDEQEFFYLKKSLMIDGIISGQIVFLNVVNDFTEIDRNVLSLLTNLFVSYLKED